MNNVHKSANQVSYMQDFFFCRNNYKKLPSQITRMFWFLCKDNGVKS